MRRDPEAVVDGDAGQLGGDEGVGERDIDEARPGDFERRGAIKGVGETLDNRHGDLARVLAERLGQRQRAVGLGIGPLGGTHHRVDKLAPSTGDLGEGRGEQVSDDDEGIRHLAKGNGLPCTTPSRFPIRCWRLAAAHSRFGAPVSVFEANAAYQLAAARVSSGPAPPSIGSPCPK